MEPLDVGILWCVHQHDEPIWKARIHDCVTDGAFPVGEPSLQTVGRHVQHLMQEGYLDSVIVSPENIDRDLIIAFTLTEQGVAVLETERKKLLRDVVRDNLFDDGEHLPKDTIVTLIEEEYDLDEEEADLLREYSVDEIKHMVCMEYTEREALTVFKEHEIKEFHDPPPGEKIKDFISS